MILGQLPWRKIASNPNSNPNPSLVIFYEIPRLSEICNFEIIFALSLMADSISRQNLLY